MTPIYATPEFESWTRSFSYDDYVKIMCKAMNTCPVSEYVYVALCEVFFNEMTRQMQEWDK